MKGKWIPNLLKRLLDGSLTISETYEFVLWRFTKKKSPIKIEGLLFKEVDRILWGLISNIFVNREYTPRGFEIGSNDVIIDIGAHKGVFVGFASRRTKNLIIAVEPDPENFKCLERFIRDNGIEHVQQKEIAIDIESGETTLYQAQSSSCHTLIGVDQKSGEQLVKKIRVKALSLSDLLSSMDTVDFLKMDCEGAELNILLNIEEEALRKVKRLVAEVHWIGREQSLLALKHRLAKIYRNINFVKTSTNLGIIYASLDK